MRTVEEYFDVDYGSSSEVPTTAGLTPNITSQNEGRLHIALCYYEGIWSIMTVSIDSSF